jgi:fagellar hook-basal body proteins
MGLSGALYSGISGIRAHQSMLDIIGNNLANINTYGYKSSRLLFSDMLSQTIATGANGNPMQVGKGVKLANISSDFSTGSMDATGSVYDLGIEGEGFFVVSNGDKNFFTRVGAFELDGNNVLIDKSSSYKVTDTNGNEIIVPINSTVSGQATSVVTVEGNLDNALTSSEAEVLIMTTSLEESSVAATATTALNDLDSNATDYSDGNTIIIRGTKSDGSSIPTTTFTYGLANDGTTVGDLISVINTAFSGDATASLDASGKIVLKADTAEMTN